MPYVLESLSKYVLIAYSFTESLLQKDIHVGSIIWNYFYAISNTNNSFSKNEKEPPHNY